MRSNPRHKISVSDLPKNFASHPRARQPIKWDKKDLLSRLNFVLSLMSENPVIVHVEFVDEVQMGELNWQFRAKDTPTDVLSFPPHQTQLITDHNDGKSGRAAVNFGELAVCVEVCAIQAKRHRCTLAEEIERMIVHGLVHLRGFDHERSDAAHFVMSGLEKLIRMQLLKNFGEPVFCQIEESKRARTMKRGPGR